VQLFGARRCRPHAARRATNNPPLTRPLGASRIISPTLAPSDARLEPKVGASRCAEQRGWPFGAQAGQVSGWLAAKRPVVAALIGQASQIRGRRPGGQLERPAATLSGGQERNKNKLITKVRPVQR